MSGFKWHRIYYGPHASPIPPQQIANGQLIAVTVRLLLQPGLYFVFMLLFGAVPEPTGWVSDRGRGARRAWPSGLP